MNLKTGTHKNSPPSEGAPEGGGVVKAGINSAQTTPKPN